MTTRTRQASTPLTLTEPRAPQLTDGLKRLDNQIVTAWHEAEGKAKAVYVLITEAEKRRLWAALGFSSLTEYLSERLKCGLSTARHFANMGKFRNRYSLPNDLIESLPASATRELAAFSFRSDAKREQIVALIEGYKQKGLTVEEFRQVLVEAREHARDVPRAMGKKKTSERTSRRKARSLRLPDEDSQAVQESSNPIHSVTGSDNLPRNMEPAAAEPVALVVDELEDAMEGMISVIDLARKRFANLQALALEAEDRNATADANSIRVLLAQGAFVLSMIVGQFIPEDSDLGGDTADEAFTLTRQDPGDDLVQRSSMTWMRVHARTLGLSEDFLRQLDPILDADELDDLTWGGREDDDLE